MDGILVLMEKIVKITNVLQIILSKEKGNVVMVIVAKQVTVNDYIQIHAPKNVIYVQNAKNGIVQKYIHVPELDLVLIKKTTNLACLCLHPPERAKLLCSVGADYRDLSCKLNHLPERPTICDQLDTCSNFNCTRLHGTDWNPCEAGENCEDEHIIINPQEKTKLAAAATTDNNKNKNRKTKKCLKNLEQRLKEVVGKAHNYLNMLLNILVHLLFVLNHVLLLHFH
jgi:hypothetical protein